MTKEQINKTIIKRICSKINKDLWTELKNVPYNNEASNIDVAIWNVQIYIK
jgi:hypothetical protein